MAGYSPPDPRDELIRELCAALSLARIKCDAEYAMRGPENDVVYDVPMRPAVEKINAALRKAEAAATAGVWNPEGSK